MKMCKENNIKFISINNKIEFKNTKARKWLSSLLYKSCWSTNNNDSLIYIQNQEETDEEVEGDFVDSYRHHNKEDIK